MPTEKKANKLTSAQIRALDYLINVAEGGCTVPGVHYRGAQLAAGPTWDRLRADGYVEDLRTFPHTLRVTQKGRDAYVAHSAKPGAAGSAQ